MAGLKADIPGRYVTGKRVSMAVRRGVNRGA